MNIKLRKICPNPRNIALCCSLCCPPWSSCLWACSCCEAVSCTCVLGWLGPCACDLRGAETAWEMVFVRAGRENPQQHWAACGRATRLLLTLGLYVCSYVSFQMYFLVASYLSTGCWTCYFLKHIACGSWLKSCCSVSLFFHLARILSYSFC